MNPGTKRAGDLFERRDQFSLIFSRQIVSAAGHGDRGESAHQSQLFGL
jgi:hypothetical protein